MKESGFIEELHEIQKREEKNYLMKKDIVEAARHHQITPARAYGVATFYTMFSVQPRGRHIIRVCRNLSCHLAGAEKIVEKLKETLGVDFGQTTEDGEFTLEESSCLGMCSLSPAMMIDDVPYGNLTPEKIPEILEEVRRREK